MASGYEKSPDYGGPEPKLWPWIVGILAAAVAALIYLGTRYEIG